MDKKKLETIKKTADKLFEMLQIEGTVVVEEAEEGASVVLSTEESGIVIGHHGETLEALQLVLSLVVAKEFGEFVRIALEVGDYRKSREEYVRNLATSSKERAISEGREITLPTLKSWERRVIHLMFQDDKEVTSESVGEGKERVLVVKPR
ncbi:MAG: R3H domain-containing nucleic acid-binding protein [Candidatus Levyibacteriota bacterium]